MTLNPQGPGAIAIVARRGNPHGQSVAAARAAFARIAGAQTLALDRLFLAWKPSPMRQVAASEDMTCLLEGSLYELDDLRRAAPEPGPPARLVAAAYSREGEAILQSLRGDFWILLWDGKLERGVVVSDQMGGRCPHWARSSGDVLVAGEIPELLTALPRRPGPDTVAMAHWLAGTEAPPARSLYEGVRRLEAGHLLELGQDHAEPRRYWTPRYQEPLSGSAAELAQQLRTTLERAVRRRAAGSADVGVLLSGGLDSSAVAALAIASSGTEPAALRRAYSATFPSRPAADEARWVDRTAAYLGLPSTRIVVRGGSPLAGALHYLGTWKVPPTSPNLFFWAPLLERAGSDGIEVMLDGEGGDELFGCSPYLLADRLRSGRLMAAARLATRFPGRARPLVSSRTWRLLRRYALKGALPAAGHGFARRVRGPSHYAPRWMPPKVAEAWLETDATWRWKEIPGPRWWAWQVDTVTRGLGPALVYEQSRRRAAAAGLDARHPLVDVDVVELALSLPPDMAFDARHSRPTLRQAVTGLLPEDVRLRADKTSFDAVFHAALAGPDLPALRRILGASDAQVGAYADLDLVRRTMLDPDPPTGGGSLQSWAIDVWRFVLAECWLRSQLDPSYVSGLVERRQLETPDYDLVAG